jgi:mannosyltransferase OCH1-like enzyme
MNIIEKNIDLSKLHDCSTESYAIRIGYNNLQFTYDTDYNYRNTEIIPKNIHFIWIGNPISEKYVNTVANCKKINNEYNVILWVDYTSIYEEAAMYLHNSGIIIKNIYIDLSLQMHDNGLKNYISNLLGLNSNYGYKADIIRLYVVYMEGGIYSDIDSIWIKPLDSNFDYEFVTYRIDKQCSNFTNSFFGFNRGSVILSNLMKNLNLSIGCFLKENDAYKFKAYIPMITGPDHLTYVIKNSKPKYLNYIHQGYCVIGGPHEEIYSYFYDENKSYCYQTFDKNWC